MVIHEESESPVEISVIREPDILKPKKYLMISNHVRELPSCNEVSSQDNFATDKSGETTENVPRKQSKSSSKKRKLDSKSEDGSKATEISECDLNELRTVYQNCLAVIDKIESKYGHLLNIDRRTKQQNIGSEDLEYEEICKCTRNKKIVFDDDGTQYTREVSDEDHICPRNALKLSTETCNVETDAQDYSYSLPTDLPSLAKMLRDPSLNVNCRNKVIQKVNNVKQEHCMEIKFNKPGLIQTLKRDPDEVLRFKGVNLSSLPGYS